MKLPNPTADKFFRMAQNYIDRLPVDERDRLPMLVIGSDEFDAWVWYFDHHLRWRPVAFDQFLLGWVRGFTVPAQWPEWLDSDYVPPARVPKVPRETFSKEGHETIEELQARHGRTYGIGGTPVAGSYFDLGRRYGRPIGRFERGSKWEAYAGRPITERLPPGMAQVAERAPKIEPEIPISDALKSVLRRQLNPAEEDA